MIPQSLLLCSLHPRPGRLPRILPHYLTEADRPWIRQFYAEFLRLEGQPRRAFLERFREPLPFDSPQKKRELLFLHLMRSAADPQAPRSRPSPKTIRAELFGEAARSPEKPAREPTIKCVSARLKLDPERLLERAFSDLALERPVTGIPKDLSPERLQLEANLLLAKGLLARSSEITIEAQGNVRNLVRQAKLRRLICHVSSHSNEGSTLEISGPLSLFGHTLVYGRALSELAPIASWCPSFSLSARCRIRGRDGLFELKNGAPILPSTEPRLFDSKLEERFARDCGRATQDWDLIREPEPVEIPGTPKTLVFPDFLLRHRRVPERRWLLEIVGFWTEDYVRRKFERLKAARIDNLILLVDRSLVCGREPELTSLGHVFFFKRRIDPEPLLGWLSRH